MKHSIERIHDAFRRAHAIVTGQLVDGQRAHYMSIPPDRERDADMILSDAIGELAELRPAVAALTAERDELKAKLAAAEATVARLSDWTVRHGASLCPKPGYFDSYGDGVRAMKEEVRHLLYADAALAPRANGGPDAR